MLSLGCHPLRLPKATPEIDWQQVGYWRLSLKPGAIDWNSHVIRVTKSL